jgi:hypothetical protein
MNDNTTAHINDPCTHANNILINQVHHRLHQRDHQQLVGRDLANDAAEGDHHRRSTEQTLDKQVDGESDLVEILVIVRVRVQLRDECVANGGELNHDCRNEKRECNSAVPILAQKRHEKAETDEDHDCDDDGDDDGDDDDDDDDDDREWWVVSCELYRKRERECKLLCCMRERQCVMLLHERRERERC